MASDSEIAESKLTLALGWFSIGLGVAQILAPEGVSRLAGLRRDRAGLMRMLGFRELITGVGILASKAPKAWLGARVAGDAADLTLLGAAFASDGADRGQVAAATAAVAGVTALDVFCFQQMRKKSGAPIHAATGVIVDRPAGDLYQLWRDFERLPRIMNHLESVKILDQRRSHWMVKAPAGMRVEWDAEIIEDRPDEFIAWRSLPEAIMKNSGSVQFIPAVGGRGTLLKVELQYEPPGGKLGAMVAKLFGEAPEQQLRVDLRRFKQLMETGEIARTEGQSAGRARSTSRKYDDLVRA
jgi:uncharacterized membrane protein